MRDSVLNIRLSEAEKNKLRQISNETGLNYAQIFRDRVFNENPLLIEIRDTIKRIEGAVCEN